MSWQTTALHTDGTLSYTDDYAALVPGIGAFFGNRSIVIHYPNKTRITCANFVRVADGSAGPGTAPVPLPPVGTGTVPYGNVSTPIGGAPSTPTPSSPPPSTTAGETPATPLPSSGAARDMVFGGAAALAAFVAALL